MASTMAADNNSGSAGGVGGGGIASKSSSNKSLRKCKLITDFEVLPEDVEAVIPAGSKRKNRNPPSPLNLNLQQVNIVNNIQKLFFYPVLSDI